MAQTVLIVEDGDNVVPLEIALGSLRDIKIQVLPNGREALRALKDHSLDLAAVITDLNLPFVDGYGIVKAIRSDERHSELPIIVISGEADPETPSRLRNLGVNAFFPKPYSPTEIRQTLEDLIHAT
jgi:CheY-like chemotaxis protein